MKKSEIGSAASKLTREEFAEELSSHIALTAQQIEQLFPTTRDREELARLTQTVLDAVDENEARAKLLANIGAFATAAVRIIRRGLVGI